MKDKKDKIFIKKILVAVNLLILAVAFGLSVIKQEKYIKQPVLYLKLAPVDPRSIMQGDYMVLNYEITDKALRDIRNGVFINKGYLNIKIDKNGVGEYTGISTAPVNDDNKNMVSAYFTFNGMEIDININSYMFQEGDGEYYSKAEYAQVILVKNRLRLKKLTDKDFKVL